MCESPIMENPEQEKDFNDYPVVKTYGADLFQRDVTEHGFDDGSEQLSM